MKPVRTLQQGFAAIAAIFLVVILAALGSFMLTFSNTQQLTSAQDVQGSRAYWAARAGLEWGLVSVSATTVCPVQTANSIGNVNGFAVTVSHCQNAYTDGGAVTIIQFTSTATLGVAGTPGYIERSLYASRE